MIVSGINLAIIELYLFYKLSEFIRYDLYPLQMMEPISYYWLMFTILTGLWEATFIDNRTIVKTASKQLIMQEQHVWTNDYTLDYLQLDKFAIEFYSEYGAYADREYMTTKDYWSRLIEGSHAFICALFSYLGLFTYLFNIYLGNQLILIAMSAQCMNSILYVGQYLIQVNEEYHINENRKEFPAGKYLMNRPFFYINTLWTIMPIYVTYNIIFNNYYISI